MSEIDVDLSRIPDDVRERLAELDLELSEGKTQTIERKIFAEEA